MLNSIVIIGIKKSNTFRNEEDSLHYCRMLLDVQRNVKEADGSTITDTFLVKVFRGMGDKLDEQIPIGSLIAIRGRIEEVKDHMCIVIAEKMVYLNEELTTG